MLLMKFVEGRMMRKILDLFKTKPEILEQMAHDVTYSGNCPVCKNSASGIDHKTQMIPFDRGPMFDSKMLLECSDCHCAFYGRITKRTRTRQIYEKISDGPDGLRLVSRELL